MTSVNKIRSPPYCQETKQQYPLLSIIVLTAHDEGTKAVRRCFSQDSCMNRSHLLCSFTLKMIGKTSKWLTVLRGVWLTATHVPPSSPDNLAAAGCQVIMVFCSRLSNTALFKGMWPLKPVHFRYESTSLSFIEYSKIRHSSGWGVLQAQVYGKTGLKLTKEWATNNSWESS